MPKLVELAQVIKAELMGDPEADITGAQEFDAASNGDITLATKPAFVERINESRATAIIVSAPVPNCGRNLLIAANPKLAFARAIAALHAAAYQATGVSDDLIIGDEVSLGSDLSIQPRVTIGSRIMIGDRVTLHSGVVNGGECRHG